MSQLDIKIRKLQDNGSTFRANIETLYLGGVRSAKVDELRFELPEEWKSCTVTLHVQRLSGTKPDPQILDENNSALVDRRWTLEKEGTWMLLAINDSGYIAMTKPGKYTCYDTIDTDTTTENITPSIYEQFVAEVTKYAKKALESMNAAKTSETAAKQALKDTEDRHTAALQDIARARTAALNDVANSTRTATAAANTATQQATAAAGSASTAATKAGEASTSAGAAKNDADRAEKASTNAANAAMKALKEAAASGAFKGDPGAQGPQGPQGPSGTIIRAYDISLASSGWKATSDSSAKSAGLAYQYDASVSGCTSALEPNATIRLESVAVAQKAGLGSICQSESGYCRFYAAKVPSAAISLRLLLMERIPT